MTTIVHGGIRRPAARPRAALPALTRTPRTVRINRLVLGIVGSLMVIAGAGGLLAGTSRFGAALARETVLSGRTDDVARNSWFWPVTGVGAAFIGFLALRWLVLQFRTNRLGVLTLDSASGRTTIHTDAICDALEREIGAYLGVSRVKARFAADRHGNLLTLVVTIDGPVSPDKIRQEIVNRALARLRSTLREATPPVELEFVLPRTTHRALG